MTEDRFDGWADRIIRQGAWNPEDKAEYLRLPPLDQRRLEQALIDRDADYWLVRAGGEAQREKKAAAERKASLAKRHAARQRVIRRKRWEAAVEAIIKQPGAPEPTDERVAEYLDLGHNGWRTIQRWREAGDIP